MQDGPLCMEAIYERSRLKYFAHHRGEEKKKEPGPYINEQMTQRLRYQAVKREEDSKSHSQ